MRVRKVNYKNTESLMIYITKGEQTNKIILDKIESFKIEYKGIALFISGSIKMENVLTSIVQERR